MDVVEVHCPWCFEPVEVSIPLDLWGETYLDCEVCCRPWRMNVERDDWSDPVVTVDRGE